MSIGALGNLGSVGGLLQGSLLQGSLLQGGGSSGSNLAGAAAVIGAVLQTELVDSVIGAIRTADSSEAARSHFTGESAGYCGPCPHPCYAPKEVIELPAQYLPRQVIHLPPRIEGCFTPPPLAPLPPGHLPDLGAAPPPPWKALPPVQTGMVCPVIKVTVGQSDMKKGTVLDLVI